MEIRRKQPWRLRYIRSARRLASGCVFCGAARARAAGRTLVLARGQSNYIILNKYPYNNGHLMVIPYEHTSDLSSLDAETTAEMMEEVKYWISRMKPVMKTDGFNVGMNLGRGAGTSCF